MITKASPTKLRSGEWGARVSGSVREGDKIEITTKAGKTWTAIVKKVVWSKDGISIVATEESKSRNGYTPAKRDSRGYVTERGHDEGYCGYPCPVSGQRCCPENGPCHDCV
jgi:hypothetical protein